MKFRCIDPADELIKGQIYEGYRNGEWVMLDGPVGIRFPQGGSWYACRFESVAEPVRPVPDLKKPLQTKDGRAVRYLGKLANGDIIGAILNKSANGDYEKAFSWSPDGTPSNVGTIWDCARLVNVQPKPAKATAMMLLYRTNRGVVKIIPDGVGSINPSSILGRVEVTIAEGNGMGGVS